jgi:hypothetical protein
MMWDSAFPEERKNQSSSWGCTKPLTWSPATFTPNLEAPNKRIINKIIKHTKNQTLTIIFSLAFIQPRQLLLNNNKCNVNDKKDPKRLNLLWDLNQKNKESNLKPWGKDCNL